MQKRPAWWAFRASLPVPVQAFHVNDSPDDVAAAARGAAPAVVAHTGDNAVLLLDREQLEGIGGDLEAFGSPLEAARLDAALDWPTR